MRRPLTFHRVALNCLICIAIVSEFPFYKGFWLRSKVWRNSRRNSDWNGKKWYFHNGRNRKNADLTWRKWYIQGGFVLILCFRLNFKQLILNVKVIITTWVHPEMKIGVTLTASFVCHCYEMVCTFTSTFVGNGVERTWNFQDNSFIVIGWVFHISSGIQPSSPGLQSQVTSMF